MSNLPRPIKRLVNSLLRERGYHVTYVPPNSVTGLQLRLDLPLVVRNLAPIIFDVGANTGQSIELFKSVFPRSTIHAFEPAKNCCETLRHKYSGQDVIISNTALGSEVRRYDFNEYESSVLNSVLTLDEHVDNRFREMKLIKSYPVSMTTLDRAREAAGNPEIDLLKIDTQGFDFEVLRGGCGALRDNAINAIMVELNFVPMYVGQATATSICEFLWQSGFMLIDCYEKHRQRHGMAWCTALFSRSSTTGMDGNSPVPTSSC